MAAKRASSGGNVVPVLRHLKKRERREVLRLFETRSVEAGATLMAEGDSADVFVLLCEGSAEAHTGAERVRSIEPGGFFGELALLPRISGTTRRTATVVTTSDSSIRVCDAAAFTQLIDRFPRVGGEILAQAYRLST